MRDSLVPRWNSQAKRILAQTNTASRGLRIAASLAAAVGVGLLMLCGGLAIASIDGTPVLCGIRWPLLDEGVAGVAKLAALAAVVVIVVAALRGIALRAAHQEAHAIVAKLRRSIHAQGLRQGGAYLLGDRDESPRALFTDDCETIGQGAAQWASAYPFLHATVFILIALAAAADPWWALLGVLLLAAGVWTMSALQKYAEAKAEQFEEEARRTEQLLLERLDLAAVTAALMLADEPGEAFTDTLDRHEGIALRADAVRTGPAACFWLILGLGAALLLLVIAASDRPSERSSPAAAVVVMSSLAAAAVLLREAPRMGRHVQRVNASALRIATYLDREPPFRMAQQAQALPRLTQAVELREVTLADRRGERMLDRVSVSLPIGAMTAVVADDRRSSRALVGLLTRLFDPAAGAVLYDGRDIREGTLDTSRGQTAVAGERLLFTGSLRQNITCDDPSLDPADLDRALELAGLEPLISSLPQGADTIIGGQAMHLDALGAFRVTLARALARNPSLLVIVEPHLAKPEEGVVIDQLLQNVATGRVLVVIPARSATLRHAANVLVLGQGRLAAAGQHVQLVQQHALYRHLVYTQFSQSAG